MNAPTDLNRQVDAYLAIRKAVGLTNKGLARLLGKFVDYAQTQGSPAQTYGTMKWTLKTRIAETVCSSNLGVSCGGGSAIRPSVASIPLSQFRTHWCPEWLPLSARSWFG